MSQFLLVLVVALTAGAVVFGVVTLLSGDADGLREAEPDGRAVPLPTRRPLLEGDLAEVRFDTSWRGYRMSQVDAAMRRVAYDLGYKDELVKVLQAEVSALREGRFPDAEVLRRAREAAVAQVEPLPAPREPAGPETPATAVTTSPASPPAAPAPDPELPATPGPSGSEPAGPAAVEPEADEREAVEPEAVEPEAVEPEAVEREAVEPEAVEREAVEPEAVEREAAEPGPEAEPEPAEPGPR